MRAAGTATGFSVRSSRVLAGLAIAGGVIFALGLVLEPRRAWGGFLMGFTYFTGLALAGGLFLSLATLAAARWYVALRRIPEAMAVAAQLVDLEYPSPEDAG